MFTLRLRLDMMNSETSQSYTVKFAPELCIRPGFQHLRAAFIVPALLRTWRNKWQGSE